MKARITLLVIVLLTASLAGAQQLPPGKWWQRPEIVRELQLTSEQRDRLDTTFNTAANGLIDAKAEVEKLQVALRAEIDRPQLRRAEIQELAARVSEARGKMFERELMLLVDMRGVLNDQQWDRLRSHLDRMQERRGGMDRPGRPMDRRQGPGQGPGGPGRRP